MSKFGRIFWNNNDFTNVFTISESTEIHYNNYRNPTILSSSPWFV